MSSKTTNYNLHKIDLTDAPPDITVLNQNWDVLDQVLDEHINDEDNPHGVTAEQTGALPSTGGTLKGRLDVAYSTWVNDNPSACAVVSQGTDGNIDFSNELTTNVACGLRVQPIAADTTDITNHLRFRVRNNNFNHMYMMYGTHNITRGETDLEAGISPLATGCIHFVYE